MSRSIEQRVGGNNSIRSLIERGFSIEGSKVGVTEWKGRDPNGNSITVPVSPIIVIEKTNSGPDRIFTLFKPTNGRKR